MDTISIVVGLVIGFAASYLAQWPPAPKNLWNRYRFQKTRERKCYSLPRGKIHVVPSSSSEALSLYVSQNAMSCVSELSAMLRKSGYVEGRDFDVVFQYADRDSIPEDVRTDNLILVCGPKRNKLMESVIHDFPGLLNSIRFELEPEPSFIHLGRRYVYEAGCDWALIAVKRNPYNPSRTLVLLFGLRSIGTKGAGSFYASAGWAQARTTVAHQLETQSGEIEILLRVRHSEDFRTVLSVHPVIS